MTTYYHVYEYDGHGPNSKCIDVKTYTRQKDIVLTNGFYKTVRSDKKEPMCRDLPYGSFTLHIGNRFLYRYDSIKLRIDDWMKNIEEFVDEDKELIRIIHNAFYGNEYGTYGNDEVKLVIE